MFQYVVARSLANAAPETRREEIQHRYFYAYDSWAAQEVLRVRPKVVVAFENSALQTFQAAKRIGAQCVLDLPSIHHAAAREILQLEQSPFRAAIDRRKDEEVASADLMLTCSQLAAATYLEAGVKADRIHSLLLGGAETPVEALRERNHSGGLKFLFAGTFSHRKSADLILETFRRLHDAGLNATLDIVGPLPESRYASAAALGENIRVHGGTSQEYLLNVMELSDCLLLPSRFDAFGMVAAEALSCGTPVIVSSSTGAKEILDDHPDCGWVVEPNVENLYSCVRDRIADPESVRRAGVAALAAARSFTWVEYREKVSALLMSRI